MRLRAMTPFVAALAVLMLLARPSPAQEDAVAMTSLHWPPYTGSALPGGGASVRVAREAFAASGIRLAVEFYPWKRAVHLAGVDPHFAGYFPEYYAEHILEDFIFSNRMGDSPLGLIERKDDPVQWKTLADLKGRRIGVVLGYVNTDQFDRMVASGELLTDPAVDDAANIRKLAAGRLDLAVMDLNVFDFLIHSEPALIEAGKLLRPNPVLLEVRGLFACFRKGPAGEKLAALFNQGLSRIDPKAVQDAGVDECCVEQSASPAQ